MHSILKNGLKRPSDDTSDHSIKKIRILHQTDGQPTRGTKRRNCDNEMESTKRSKITPCSKGMKRSSDTPITNPAKRIKISHQFLLRNIEGCRLSYYMNDDNEGDSGGDSVLIPIVA